jgi:hypothetical protein
MALPPIVNPIPPLPTLPDNRERGPLYYLRVFYPGFFDPNSPNYCTPLQIAIALDTAEEFRPPCLRKTLGDIAQAHYAAYLLEEFIAGQATGGVGGGASRIRGPVLSEKEGDISITYADPRIAGQAEDDLAPTSGWEKWSRLNDLCKYGAITSRFGQRI